MKKLGTSVALLALSMNAAYAQSSVTLYGVIDPDIVFVNNAQTGQPQPGVPYAHSGDSRLAGFSGGQTICGASSFCLVLDGASISWSRRV